MPLGRFFLIICATIAFANAKDELVESAKVRSLARAQQTESLEQALALTKRHQAQLNKLLKTSKDEDARTQIEKRLETLANEKQRLDRQQALLALREGDDQLVIQALIDGQSTLIVEEIGMHWSVQRFAKPGQHQGAKEPTYVNGLPWQPTWRRPEETHGPDTSRPYPLQIDLKRMDFKSATVSTERNGTPQPPSESIKATKQGGVMTLDIPDNDGGSRWYTIRLSRS